MDTATQTLFPWSDDLSVGIQEIDEQHKVLVGLLNELHAAVVERKASTACRGILDRLAEYTRVHFAVEEALMRILGYPAHDAHRAEHELLTRQVVELQEKLDSGKASIGFELLHFLKVWLTKHINESDKRYSAHFISRGISPEWEQKPRKRGWKFWA